jgi:hypothetical protein
VSSLPSGWIQTELDNLLSFVIGGDWGKEPNYLEMFIVFEELNLKNGERRRGLPLFIEE